ncbi:fibronectin type III domain-containing protein [Paenibacillus cymbidii]|uniref:fibronectin type III domain-containing protein n=1 Tax=Paenibacillus cymbidii TaxID=1639034 RepID=UPI0010818611|nr:fibronectin type III domain-containing protein [Paenibacillus cymbidii]
MYETATPLGTATEFGNGLVNVAKALGITDQPIPPIKPVTTSPTPDTASTQPFDILDRDDKMTILSEKLLNLKSRALSMKKTDLVKEADRLYHTLQLKNKKLHQSDTSAAAAASKDQLKQQAEQAHLRYRVLAPEFDRIQEEYLQGIRTIAGKMFPSSRSDQNSEAVVSSKKFGDLAEIHRGDAHTIGLTLENPVSELVVEVKQGEIVISSERVIPSDPLRLQYIWQPDTSIASGEYTISFLYPDSPGWEDRFTVYVSDTAYGSQTVTASAVTIYTMALGTAYNFDVPENDYRVYKFTPSSTNYYRIFTDPYNGNGGDSDTVVEVYSDINLTHLLYENDDGSTAPFSEIDDSFTGGVSYYVKVYGYSGQSVHARIKAVISPLVSGMLTITSTADVTSPAGQNKVIKFVATTSGAYKISTTYYAGSSAQGINDTVLYVYTDPYLSNMIDSMDADGSLFATMNVNLVGGRVYFIEIGNIIGEPLKARLSVASGAAAATVISLNAPVNASTTAGTAKVYKFTPSVTRGYHIGTDCYNSNCDLGMSDHKLEVFSDVGLTNPVPFGYFIPGVLGSDSVYPDAYVRLNAQTSYYIKLSGLDGGKVYGRLFIENGEYPTQGHNDYPASGQTLTGAITGWGWVIDGSITNKVEVLIDNIVQVQAVYGDNREDVYNAYPLYNNHYAGYHFTLNTALFTNGAHNFKVRETDNNGALSIIANYTIIFQNDSVPPSSPTNLVGTVVNGNQIQLTWSPAADNVGVTGYRVYSGSSLLTTVASTTFTTAALPIAQSYSYTVVALDTAGNVSGASNQANVYIADTAPPTVPSNLTITGRTQTSVSLGWGASTDNSGSLVYDIYSNGVVVGTVTTMSFTIQGLLAGTNYSIVVKARDGSGNASAASNEIYLGYRIMTYHYDDANRIDYVQLSTGQKYKYNYDHNGNLLSIIRIN